VPVTRCMHSLCGAKLKPFGAQPSNDSVTVTPRK